MTEPENLVLTLLREMRSEMKGMRADMATKSDISDLRSEMKSGFTAVAADLLTLDAKVDKTRKELSEQIVGLRRAVVEYHSAVIGHGVIISELEARVRRIEQNLGLPSMDPN